MSLGGSSERPISDGHKCWRRHKKVVWSRRPKSPSWWNVGDAVKLFRQVLRCHAINSVEDDDSQCKLDSLWSQWKLASMAVMWSDRRRPPASWAAALRKDWRRQSTLDRRPHQCNIQRLKNRKWIRSPNATKLLQSSLWQFAGRWFASIKMLRSCTANDGTMMMVMV